MPAFAFMRNPEQGPSWFARSLGPLRLTKRTQRDVMAVPAGGIPMARFIMLRPGMSGLPSLCGFAESAAGPR